MGETSCPFKSLTSLMTCCSMVAQWAIDNEWNINVSHLLKHIHFYLISENYILGKMLSISLVNSHSHLLSVSGYLKVLHQEKSRNWKLCCVTLGELQIPVSMKNIPYYVTAIISLLCSPYFSVEKNFFLLFFSFFQEPKGLVTFTRQVLNSPPNWERYYSLLYYFMNVII